MCIASVAPGTVSASGLNPGRHGKPISFRERTVADLTAMKQYFKESSDADALKAYEWVTTAMEVRGLIQLPGTRKRRSDAGKSRSVSESEAPTFESIRERIGGEERQ